ncbi:DUF4124 domain-containing protein [Marinobacteraceae bacterium S3BR75-40.1]
MRLMLAITLAASALTAQAQIYRCPGKQGPVFSDTPCGPDAQLIDPAASGSHNLSLETSDFQAYQPPESEQHNARKGSLTGCSAGYIQSTTLRRYRIRDHVEVGMSRKQVRYILGRPDQSDGPWWVYREDGEVVGRYRFKHDCLERWR